MQPNPRYDAGFTRAVDHEADDLPIDEDRRARRRTTVVAGAVVVAIGLAIVAIGAFVALGGRTSATSPLALGGALVAGHAHESAIVELKRSLLADPEQPAVRFLLGKEYIALGDARAAEIEFGKALALHVDPEQAMPLLVASVAQQDRHEQVIALVNGATLVSPKANADLQVLLGTAYLALGKEVEARAAWKAATDRVPGHPGALLAEARAVAARGAADEAAALLDRIPPNARRQPDVQAAVDTIRGDIANSQGRLADAATAYEAALAVDPGNVPLRTRLAQTDVDLGRFDDALAQAEKIFVAAPAHPKASFIAAEAALGKQDYRAADEAIAQAIQAAPRDGKARLLAGRIAAAMGRPGDAELHLHEALALMPRDAGARRALAELHLQQREASRAEDAIAPLRATAPDDPRVAEIVARIALLQGDAPRAAKAYDPVDPTRADHVAANLRAASLKFAAGDTVGAFARLRAAGNAAPDDIDVDAALVAAYLAQRQPKDAVAAWNAMARKRPDAARTHDVRAAVDLALGDRSAARHALEKAATLDANGFAAVAGLVQLDLDERRPAEAMDRLRIFLATHPGHFDATMRLVAIEQAAGGRDDAIATLLRDARKTDSRSPRAAQVLAAFELAHGQAQQALRTADEGLLFAPGDAPLLATAGDAALANGNAARATTFFKAATTVDTGSVDYPARLGTAWLAAGDPEAALAAFRTALVRQPDDVDLQRVLVGHLLKADKTEEAGRLLFEIARLAPRSPALPALDAEIKERLASRTSSARTRTGS